MKRFLGVILLLVIIVNFWFGNLVEGVDNPPHPPKKTIRVTLNNTKKALQNATAHILADLRKNSKAPVLLAQFFNGPFKNALEEFLTAGIIQAFSDKSFNDVLQNKLSNGVTGKNDLDTINKEMSAAGIDTAEIIGSLILLILLKQMPAISLGSSGKGMISDVS